MEFQRRLQNGSWVDCSIEFIKTVGNPKEIRNRLEQGEDVYYNEDWYAELRIKPSQEAIKKREEEIKKAKIDSIKTQKKLEKQQYNEVDKYERW
jgi:hypothetical protein